MEMEIRISWSKYVSCPNPTRNPLTTLSVGGQLDALKVSDIAQDCCFIVSGGDVADARELVRTLPHVRHVSTFSSDHLLEADFAAFRSCVVLVILPDLRADVDCPAVQSALASSRDLLANESVGVVLIFFVGQSTVEDTFENTDTVSAFAGAPRGSLLDARGKDLVMTATSIGADGVLFSSPDQKLSARRFRAALQVAEAWSDRVVKSLDNVKMDMERKCKRHVQVATRKLVWNSPQTIFPHIPHEDKSLKERENGVGDYTFTRQLGRGAFGTVHLARSATGQSVAIKVVTKKKIRNLKDLAQIERELIILRGVLDHPNILRIYACLHGKGNLYIVMEYLGNYSLDAYVKMRQRGRRRDCALLPFSEVQGMVGHIMRAIVHCHRCQICHRDLKLSNMMIAPDGRVTLVDFGLAVQVARDQTLHGRCGSVPFVAPEVLSSSTQCGYDGLKVDIWSFGVNMLELLCGICSTVELLGIGSPSSAAEQLEAIRRTAPKLADPELQKMALDIAGEDITAFRADLEQLLEGALCLEPEKRRNIAELATLAAFATHAGPMAMDSRASAPTSKTNASADTGGRERLKVEHFGSKVDVRGIARPIPIGSGSTKLLEGIGGSRVVHSVVNTAFDWLLPRPEFADFFLSCPLQMGRIRASTALFLEGFLADTERADINRLRQYHQSINVSDWLFNEFADTLTQSFRIQGELALDVTRAIERLRVPITAGYRERLVEGQRQPRRQRAEVFEQSDVEEEDFARVLNDSLHQEARFSAQRFRLPTRESLDAFAASLWNGDVDSAARAVFACDEARAIFDQGFGCFVFLFCDNVRRVLSEVGVSDDEAESMTVQLGHLGEVIAASDKGAAQDGRLISKLIDVQHLV